MKMIKNAKVKIILLALLALAALGVAGGSLAAYTSQDYQRGVARNRDAQAVRFTSNYLQACAMSEINYANRVKLYEQSSDTSDLDIEILVYNYVAGNENLVSEKDIQYTMNISLADGTLPNYTVKQNDTAILPVDGVYSASSTLIGRTPQKDSYIITISSNDIDKIKITAVATPTSSAITGNQKLAAVIVPCTNVNTETVFTYSGTFSDFSETISPCNYAAFNYKVSISGGQAKMTVTWDTGTFEIDPFFLKNLSRRDDKYNINGEKYIEETNSTNKSLTFIMDQTQGMGDYLIPFYCVTAIGEDMTWPEIQRKISIQGEKVQLQ